MQRRRLLGWTALLLAFAASAPLLIAQKSATASHGRGFDMSAEVTLSGPVKIGDAFVEFPGTDIFNFRGEIHYLLEKAKFKLDRRRSRGGLAIYRIVSGHVSGTESSVAVMQYYDFKRHYLGEDHWFWEGELAPTPLRRGDAELRVNRRTGEATLTILLPGMSGMHVSPEGAFDYDRDATTIGAAGTLAMTRRAVDGALGCNLVDPDPFAEWGGTSEVSGTLAAE